MVVGGGELGSPPPAYRAERPVVGVQVVVLDPDSGDAADAARVR